MSARADIAKRLGVFIRDNDLCHIYGGDVTLSGDKKYREVGFSSRCNLDGGIRIYGPKFILIFWLTRFQNLPHEGQRMFKSEEEAIRFLRESFVEFKEQADD